MTRWSKASALTALLVLAVACGGGGEGTDNNANNTTNNNTTGNNTVGNNTTGETNNNTTGGSETTPPATYEDGYQMRFTSIAFVTVDPILRALNGILAENFDQELDFPIVALIDIKELDAEAGTFQLKGGSGLKTLTPEVYEWDPQTPDTYSEATIDADTAAFDGLIERFVFVAVFESDGEVQRTELILHDLEFTGNLDETDGVVTIPNGMLKGFVKKEEADLTEIELTPGNVVTLTEVLKEDKLNFDFDEDGTNDSWELEARFTAEPTEIR
jgi:hypothetical protein